MKLLLSLLAFIYSSSAIAQTAQPVKKLALIVAVGQYPESSGWSSIASINDVKYVKGALLNKGFKEKDIDTLKNNKATKAGILTALDKLAKKVAGNDIVVIHFSCHGQQIQDQATEAGGKDEEDGYDEALIPYDAQAMYNPTTYNGEKHLRDDDLEKKFTAIRNKIKPNGNLLVLIDACHSGTASRAAESSISRGKPFPFEEPGYKADVVLHLSSKAGSEKSFIGDGTDSLANMVVISASAPNQQNFQLWDDKGVDVGSLSFAFAKAMADIQPGDDYQLLFEKIKARIQAGIPTQIPMIEGNTNQEVLGAKFNAPKNEIILTISKTDKEAREDSVFIINKGVLDNVSKGSTCKIFIAGKKEEFAEGTIVKVGTFQSTGVTNKLLKKEVAYRATIKEVSFGDFSTSIAVVNNSKGNTKLKNQLSYLFQPYKFITINNNAELMLNVDEQSGKVKMELFDRGDSTRWVKELAENDTLKQEETARLISSIKKSIRVKYLRSLPDGGNLIKDFQAQVFAENDNNTATEKIFKPGDHYTLKLVNNGKEDLFYSIVDIMPDNEMKVLIPTPSKEPQDYLLRSKQSRSFPVRIDDNTCWGKEVFKVFITKAPIDLKSLFDRKNKATRNITMSLEDMINDTFKDGSDAVATRSDVSAVKLNEVGILTVGFTIKKQ